MTNDDIGRKLDMLITISKLAHHDSLERVATTIREDKLNVAILSATKKWASPAQIQAAVLKKSQPSKRTIARRIEELLAIGILERQGAGPKIEYRATGLI